MSPDEEYGTEVAADEDWRSMLELVPSSVSFLEELHAEVATASAPDCGLECVDDDQFDIHTSLRENVATIVITSGFIARILHAFVVSAASSDWPHRFEPIQRDEVPEEYRRVSAALDLAHWALEFVYRHELAHVELGHV